MSSNPYKSIVRVYIWNKQHWLIWNKLIHSCLNVAFFCSAATRMIANALSHDSPPPAPARRPDNRLSVTVSNMQANKSNKAGRFTPSALVSSASWAPSAAFLPLFNPRVPTALFVSRKSASRRGERFAASEVPACDSWDGRQVHHQHAQGHHASYTPNPGSAGQER